MWTQTLSLNKSYEREFACLLNEVAKLPEISYATEKSRDRMFITVAAEDDNANAVRQKLKKIIRNIILIFFKYNHLSESVNEPLSLSLFTLYAALIFFEADEDKVVIENSLESIRDYAIDSIFYFKMQSIMLKWNELAKLCNNLLSMNPSDDDILNVVAFLLDLQENKSELVLSYGNGYEIRDAKNRVVQPLDFFDDPKQNLLLTLVSAKPGVIIVKNISDGDVLNILSKIAKVNSTDK